MRLSELLSDIYNGEISDSPIEDITFDSRRAHKDSIFICIRGSKSDGHDFAASAYEAGCRVFAAEHRLELPSDAVQLICHDTTVFMAELADAFYRHPQRELTLIGITGTKGKTTVASYLRALLTAGGYATASIGTNGIEYGDEERYIPNTTPDSITLHRTFRELADKGVTHLVMEVSSQAYKLNRVHGINFDIGLFTNFSPDHISPTEHPDLDDYRRCKGMLFSNSNTSILNVDDPAAEYMASCARGRVVSASSSEHGDYCAERIRSSARLGMDFDITGALDISLSIPYPGIYSVQNALLAAAAANECGVPAEVIKSTLERAYVRGRCERVDVLPYADIVIDYAHNEVSLRSLLQAIREHMRQSGRRGRLISLFGAVGGKSQIRRHGLAAAAEECSDYVIVTDDNPDFEAPEKIISEVVEGFSLGFSSYTAMPDREKAVRYAVDMLEEGDVLLLCGKGHEDYQLIRGEKVPFCERDIVRSEAERLSLARR